MEIRAFLDEQRADVIQEAVQAVRRAGLSHYAKAGEPETRRRLEQLYDTMCDAVTRRELGPVTAHATEVARERFESGFGLSEVQTAFNVLEEAVWRRILERVPPAGFAEAIGTVSTLLGAGKDALAREYVSLASRTQAPSLDLSRLFRGTTG